MRRPNTRFDNNSSAYDLVANESGQQALFNMAMLDIYDIDSFHINFSISYLFGMAATATTKLTGLTATWDFTFSDGSTMEAIITDYDFLDATLTVEFKQAKDAQGNPIHPDPNDYAADEFETETSEALFEFFEQQGIPLKDQYGQALGSWPLGQSVVFSCHATGTGVECTVY